MTNLLKIKGSCYSTRSGLLVMDAILLVKLFCQVYCRFLAILSLSQMLP